MAIDDNTSDTDDGNHNNGEPLPPLMYSLDDASNDINVQGTPSGYVPPKWTPFTNGFCRAVYYITMENARRSIPYQEAPLAPSAKLDSLLTINSF